MLTLLCLIAVLYFHQPLHWWLFIVWAVEAFVLGRKFFVRGI